MTRLITIAGIAGMLFTASCGNKLEKHEEASTFKVTTPMEKDTMYYKEYVCQIHSISHIELRSQERGYIQNIYVDEGQFVKKGQLMFKIMPVIYQAEMHKAEAEANFTELEYQNTKNLYDSNIVSKNELSLAKARFNKAKAELSLAQAHLGFTEIRAPFDGIMGRFLVRLGSLIDEGELLTTLSDNRKVWAYFNVPEAEYLDYITHSRGDSLLTVNLKMANNQLFNQEGKVETIEADFNNETGNIAFRATFQNGQGILRHGETGSILMPVNLKHSLIIPQKATFEILDKKYVYVVEDHVVKTRQVTIGVELPHLYVVTEGIKPNEKILLDGLRKVKNNQRIEYTLVSPDQMMSEFKDLHAE
ncbi:MAG: efflux RND transporter periplasmic adaptor subunit [Chitinophagaceae bacterium]|nr:efflux RND transporter periplasmic adaptor subunit [Chitinophagaceae bacterium]